MEPFVRHEGTVLPLRRSAVDTDQIIPARFLKRTSRHGYADGLFAAWREEPGFVLDEPARRTASILVAGPDFGVGSSREHAVWALQDHGFRAVVSARFGDIFASNAASCGLLALTVAEPVAEQLLLLGETSSTATVVIDLETRRLAAAAIELDVDLDVPDFLRWRLMHGLDDVGITLQDESSITAFEHRRETYLPTTVTR